MPGIFAFDHPEKLFDTYSWIHMKKNPDNYEMIIFKGKLIDKPTNSEGVVVKPEEILDKVPLRDWARRYLLDKPSSTKMTQSRKRGINW